MSAEIHIAGVVVHVAPQRLTLAGAAIAALPGAAVHATNPQGKLVVTLEAESSAQILAQLEAAQRIEGVLSAVLVYQHAESVESMNEEVSDEGIET